MSASSSLESSSLHSLRADSWRSMPLDVRRQLLKEDRQAGERVCLILASTVGLGTLMMIVTVLLAI